MIEDKQLIRQYAADRSEPAFAELVGRHLKMVYAAALRQVNGDTHLAEDVAQTVFADLARKAGKLQQHGSIAGWLYASTRFVAANAVRGEARRRAREQAAVSMNEMNSNSNADWNQLRPMIDEALGELGEDDREAIVLRYFEAYEFSLVGAALGVSENAARMRVDRALEKLRGVLQRRGLATTGAALGGVLVQTAAIAVPAQLAAHITGAALAQAATAAAGSTVSILKLLLMKKITLAIVALLAVSLATVVLVKTLPKSPPSLAAGGADDWMKDEPGVRKFRWHDKVLGIRPGETLIAGGWSTAPGRRMLVLLTPTMIDPSGNKVDPPFSAQSQIEIDAKFVEATEPVLVKLGLQGQFTEQNDTEYTVRESSDRIRSLINAIEQSDGSELLSAPRVTTLLGHQAAVSVQETQMIAGKNHPLGPSLDALATLDEDPRYIVLDATAKYAIAAHGTSQ